MKILFTRFPLESRFGGAEIQTLSLMKGLAKRGHDVAFLGSCPVLLKETTSYSLHPTPLTIGPPPVTKWNLLHFFWKQKTMKEKLENALTAFRLPLAAIFMLSLSEKLLLTETAVKKGIRVFWIEHDRVGLWLTKNPLLPKLRKLSATVTTICVSELSRQIYIDLGWDPKKVMAIPNGIDLQRFSKIESSQLALRPCSEQATRNSQLCLGCVARLSHEKGVDVLIQAVSGIPEVDLTIIGSGPEEGYLRKLVEQIHTVEMVDRERIRIVAHMDDVGAFYRSVDALVLPSRDNDPFGLVVAEAMACGTPVIVTDQCGIAGYLRDGQDAVICRANSDAALREAVLRMMNPKIRTRLAIAGMETARENFPLQRMIDAYADLL